MKRAVRMGAVLALVGAMVVVAGCMTPEQGRAKIDQVAGAADAKIAAIQDKIAAHRAELAMAEQVVAGAAAATEPLSPEWAAALKIARDTLSDAPALIEALEQDAQSVEAWRVEQTAAITDDMSKSETTWAVISGVATLASILIGGGGVRWGLSRGAAAVADSIAKARSVDPAFNAAFKADDSPAVEVMKRALSMAPAPVVKAVAKANNEYPAPAVTPMPS